MFLRGTLLLFATLDIYLDGFGGCCLFLFRSLLFKYALRNELLRKAKGGGKRPIQHDACRRDEGHPNEHDAHEAKHHGHLALVLLVLPQLYEHGSNGKPNEQEHEDDVWNGIGHTLVKSIRYRLS